MLSVHNSSTHYWAKENMPQRLQAIQIQPQMYNIAADNNVSIQNIFSEIASFVYLMMMPFFYLYL